MAHASEAQHSDSVVAGCTLQNRDSTNSIRISFGLPVRPKKPLHADSLRFSSPSNSLGSVMPIVVSVLLSLRSLVRSRAALHLEILALRRQRTQTLRDVRGPGDLRMWGCGHPGVAGMYGARVRLELHVLQRPIDLLVGTARRRTCHHRRSRPALLRRGKLSRPHSMTAKTTTNTAVTVSAPA